MTRRRPGQGGADSDLLLVANDLFHPYHHRIKSLAEHLESVMTLRRVSLVPPGLRVDGTQASPHAFLRGWARLALEGRCPPVWQIGGTTAVRRAPLPGAWGPMVNATLLRHALRPIARGRNIALAQGPVPARACLKEGIPFIYDHADDYGGGRVGVLHRRVLGRWQEAALRGAVAISCAGPSLLRGAMEAGTRSVSLHPNGVHAAFFDLPRRETPQPSLLYLGGVEVDCGLDTVLRAMKLMGDDVGLVVGGDGAASGKFRRLAVRLGVSSRVTWLGAVPRQEAPRVMSHAWVGLAMFAATRWNRSAFHLKIIEYMAAGLPFVTTPIGDGAAIAEETGAGRVVADDPAAAATSLQGLLGDRSAREDMSRNGRSAAKAYDWSVVGPQFARWVAATLAERS